MKCKIEKNLLLAMFLLVFIAPSISQAIQLPVPDEFQKRIDTLYKEYESISKELSQIKSRLNQDINSATEKEYKEDTGRLFQLMDDLAGKKKAIQDLRKELDDLFTKPPVLKLVRISGPTTDEQGVSKHYIGSQEIEYKPNNAGYIRRIKEASGRLYSTMGVAVTYAPLEINPGEAFHFEVEARKTTFFDPSRNCTGRDPIRIGVYIDPDNNFGSPTIAMSKADLNCQPGSVTIAMRFNPKPPLLPEALDRWSFPYNMEAVTSGTPYKHHPFKAENKEFHNFRLPVKKSDVERWNRSHYKIDVEVRPFVHDWPGLPKLVLHYRAQDESIAFLPKFQFPEDAAQVVLPDFSDKTIKEAKKWLEQRNIIAKLVAVGSAPSEALSFKIKETNPKEGSRVSARSKVTILVYGKHTIQKAVIPYLNDQPVKTAKNRLKEIGFKIRLVALGPAPTESLSFKVKETEPESGKKVPLESEVTLLVYGKYTPQKVTVPDIEGLSVKAAKTRLKEHGFKVRLSALGSAPSESLSFTVKDTQPSAGSEAVPGDEITIRVYGKYTVQLVTVPNVELLPLMGAKSKLEHIGLQPRIVEIGPAPSVNLSNKIKGTVPTEGEKVPPGSEVIIKVFSRYIPSREELVAELDCSMYPGSRAYWSESKGEPLCGCPGELTWNLARTQCITRGEKNSELCSRDYPGSVPSGRNADGNIVCDCPNGYVWSSDGTRCVEQQPQQKTGGGGNNQNDICSQYISQIKFHVSMYKATINKKPAQKSLIENAVGIARRSGCSESEIQTALSGSGIGTGGSGSGSISIDGGDPNGVPPYAWGQ